ncbi:MAG: Hpt domain-containing protein [Desulfovibrionaceae bacterium]|jgi:HPt (histidine-containing phosphotransfer) domain-containing protein|nr:Hpt domain-containing protein [Desulfovibrionaceae bacterium]
MHEHIEVDATLARLGGDRELLKELFTAFVEDVPGRLDELDEALAQADLHRAERRAHSIKGACAAVGAVLARAHAANLEQAALAGDAPRCAELRDALRAEITAAVGFMEAF